MRNFASKHRQREDKEAGKRARNDYPMCLPVNHWLVLPRRMKESESRATGLSERPVMHKQGLPAKNRSPLLAASS